jgi:hypothetical protein
MAELSTTHTPTSSCCAPEQQATCCEPAAKADCCGTSHSEGCGCGAKAAQSYAAASTKQASSRYD